MGDGKGAVRAMRAADIDRVAEIWLTTNQQAHDFIPAQYWQDHLEEVTKELLQAEGYVYEDGNIIQGFVRLRGESIEGIFVADQAQSAGVGKRLIDYVKRKKDKLELHVYQKNTRAIRFYQREGFCFARSGVDKETGEKEDTMIWRANP